ncbi:MAG TPA: GNAT family protein [Acidimicrobiales bacterium]|nr:GNAT family protein [Acidimicrobiales bacterium]
MRAADAAGPGPTGEFPVTLAVDGLVLRRSDPADAGEVAEAVNGSLAHLAPWMGWARRPARLEETAVRLALAGAAFDAGGHAEWTVLRSEEGPVVGACGLYQVPDGGCRQIGYWVRAGFTKQGIASASAAAMAWTAFARMGLERVEIRCDVANVRSAGVARRLGFTLVGTVAGDALTAGTTGRCEVWALARDDWPTSPAAGWAVGRR